MRSARGFTLVEAMVAGGVLSLATLALFEGISHAARLSRESAEVLQAEGVAWDAAWAAFNEDYDLLLAECRRGAGGESERTVELSAEAAPLLARYDARPVLYVTLKSNDATTIDVDGSRKAFVLVESDVAWGPGANRRRLSAVQRTFVYRGPIGRVEAF